MRTSGSVQTVPVPCVVVVYLYKTIRTPPKYSRRLCLGDEVTNPDMDLLINQKQIDMYTVELSTDEPPDRAGNWDGSGL